MKVLFVSSGNSGDASILARRQAESLMKQGVNVDFFLVKGKGYSGYLKNILPLRHYLKTNNFDVVHAHYSLSAFVGSLAGARPLVVSLMGSDVKSAGIHKFIIRLFKSVFSWSAVIVKSADMKMNLGIKNAHVIPNGVDLELFRPMPKDGCKEILGWAKNKKHILFPANPARPEKNYQLAKSAIDSVNTGAIEFHAFNNVSPEQIPVWFNASDIILMSSLWEGSPNVIKEAMACNCPIVSTQVGDVEWLVGKDPAHFLASFNPGDFSEKLQLAIAYTNKFPNSSGRERIQVLGLDSHSIAKQLQTIYHQVIRD